MSEPDPVMIRIGQAMQLGQAGDRVAARAMFSEIWNDLGGATGDPMHRCALAHSMADAQDDPREELMWDLRALEAADLVSDERAAQAGVTSPVAGFYPSLHLNLAECYRKLGDLDRATEHLSRGRDTIEVLADDECGRLIRRCLKDIERRLASAVRSHERTG